MTATATEPTPVRRQAVCGTDGGYYNHIRISKTDPCDACKRAHTDAHHARRDRADPDRPRRPKRTGPGAPPKPQPAPPRRPPLESPSVLTTGTWVVRAGVRRWEAFADQGPTFPHGTTTMYKNGCKCTWCKQARADYDRYRRRRGSTPADDDIDHVVVMRVLAYQPPPVAAPAERLVAIQRWRALGRPLTELERLTGWNVHRELKRASDSHHTATSSPAGSEPVDMMTAEHDTRQEPLQEVA